MGRFSASTDSMFTYSDVGYSDQIVPRTSVMYEGTYQYRQPVVRSEKIAPMAVNDDSGT